MKTKFIILAFILIVNLFLNIYGNNWGLPSRWYVDEKIANVLHMISDRTAVDYNDFFYHPTGYQMLLAVWLAPFLLYLKLSGYPLGPLKEAASVSWTHMAELFPDFATNIYIYSRVLSAIFGALTVYAVFLIGKKVYDEKAGFFSAACLAVTMGFAGVNHFAKYTSLEMFLVCVTLLCCVRGYLYWAAFFSGLALSVQLDAFILLVPLCAVFFMNVRGLKAAIKTFIILIIVYLMGLIIATPSLIFHFNDYMTTFKGLFISNSAVSEPRTAAFFIGPLNYFFELFSIYGVFIFGLILFGMLLDFRHFKRMTKEKIVVFIFIFVYLIMMTVISDDKYPQTKHIILAVPVLTLLAGRALSYFFGRKALSSYVRYSFFLLVLLYSFCYTIKADSVFAGGDSRYKCTEWIFANIPDGSKIETFDQINYICSESVFGRYDFIYMGRSSRDFKGRFFFKWDKVENREGYLRHINQFDSKADFIIISVENLAELYSSARKESHLPGLERYTVDLFEGRKNFNLIKVFDSGNRKVASRNIEGFYRQRSLLWDPVPSPDVVSPTIYVFKKKSTG